MKKFSDFLDKIRDHIGNTNKETEFKNKYRGDCFNIFNILDVQDKEVYMCRFLAELLDPNGKHGQGTRYLDLFYEMFLSNKITELDTNKVTIELEELTKHIGNDKEKRRMDIVIIEDNGCYIPIEVKINANEQENQCSDYLYQVERYYEVNNIIGKPLILCFLTRDGHVPTTIGEDKYENIICISWNDIVEWLKRCIFQEDTIQIGLIRENLLQFKNAINIFMGENMEKNEEIIKLLTTNLGVAKEIANNLKYAEEKVWNNFGDLIIEKAKEEKEIIKSPWLIAHKCEGSNVIDNIARYRVLSRNNDGSIDKLEALYALSDGQLHMNNPSYKKTQKINWKNLEDISSNLTEGGDLLEELVNEASNFLLEDTVEK